MENKTIELPVSLKKAMELLDIIKHYAEKDISLESNTFFEIHQFFETEEQRQNKIVKYEMQYGYPLSGSVILDFEFDGNDKTLCITGLEVYTQPADKEFMMASYSSSKQFGAVTIRESGTLDTGAKKYKGSSEIEKNPNAMLMLDAAIDDLKKARILGPSRGSCIDGFPYFIISSSTNKVRQ